MIVTIRGKIIQKMPAEIIIEAGGIGYALSISSNTYDKLPKSGYEVSLLTYFHVTENNQSLFAFSDEIERELFLMLIGVSGIGPKTAIILLSSVTPNEFKRRLIAGEVGMLTSLPGIGPKTARRIIVELKDKFVKLSPDDLPKEDKTYVQLQVWDNKRKQGFLDNSEDAHLVIKRTELDDFIKYLQGLR